MLGRLIVFIVLFLVFFLFIVFNLENKTDISFGFRTLEGIPVFVTAFFSFLAGIFCALPFIFRPRKKAGGVKTVVKTVKVKRRGLLARAVKKQGDSLTDKNYGID